MCLLRDSSKDAHGEWASLLWGAHEEDGCGCPPHEVPFVESAIRQRIFCCIAIC